MGLCVWSAAVLYIKISVHRVVGTMVHAWAQFEHVNDFVLFTIHQFDGIGIAAVRNDKTIGFRQVRHGERLAEAFDAVSSLSAAEVEDFNRFLLFRREE